MLSDYFETIQENCGQKYFTKTERINGFGFCFAQLEIRLSDQALSTKALM